MKQIDNFISFLKQKNLQEGKLKKYVFNDEYARKILKEEKEQRETGEKKGIGFNENKEELRYKDAREKIGKYYIEISLLEALEAAKKILTSERFPGRLPLHILFLKNNKVMEISRDDVYGSRVLISKIYDGDVLWKYEYYPTEIVCGFDPMCIDILINEEK